MRQFLILVSALALAYLSVVLYFSVKTVDSFDASDPTNYASDVFTTWTISYENPSFPLTSFSGTNELGESLKIVHSYDVDAVVPAGWKFVEWRGGVLMGDMLSLRSWSDEPGEMALRWRLEEGVNSRLFKSDLGYVLERSNNEVVVWEDELRIPKYVFDRGGLEIENDSSDLNHKYDAVVRAQGGTYLAVDLGDRYVWVFDDSVEQIQIDENDVSDKSLDTHESLLGIVRNHRTRSDLDILFDSERGVVEAVGEDGGVVWAVEIENEPIGLAYEIDIYKNGKYQTAFATSDGVFLIDVKGNSVKGYPYKPSADITGFAVMDYDRNRKYRFLVATSDGEISNITGEGIRTSGWNFKKLRDGVFVEHIHHIKVGSKDYIYAGCSDSSVHLLKRTGGKRASTSVKVNSNYAPAFRLSSNISKTSVLFIDAEGWLKEYTFGDALEVGISGMVKADRVQMMDTNSDGKKEVVVHYKGDRTVWNTRNERID